MIILWAGRVKLCENLEDGNYLQIIYKILVLIQ